jgi:hypothetical protein
VGSRTARSDDAGHALRAGNLPQKRRGRDVAPGQLDGPRGFEYQRRVSNACNAPRIAAKRLVAVACLALITTVAGRAGAAPPAARAALVEAERDAGVVAPGVAAVAKFRVRNEGGAPLTLTPHAPDPYMAGVETTVQGAPVLPGRTATVSVRLDTATLAGDGTVRVPLLTNDPAAEKLWIVMKVAVRPALAADPGYARYNVVQKEREGTIAQTVWSTDGATFRVKSVTSPIAGLRLAFREARADERRPAAGSQWRVESTLASDAPVGALVGHIVVVTDHPKQKRLEIPVSGFVRPVFAVTPPSADIGEVDGTRPLRFTLDVKNFATETIALERADCDLAGATVEITPVSDGRAYKVHVAVPAGLPAGPLSGKVRIFTVSAKVPEIDVPVRGQVRAATSSAPANSNAE